MIKTFTDDALKVVVAMNAANKATDRADELIREVYPIGESVDVHVDGRPPGSIITGTVRYYCMPLTGGLVIEFSPDDLAKISPCWHLRRYPNCAEINFSLIRGPYSTAMVRKASGTA